MTRRTYSGRSRAPRSGAELHRSWLGLISTEGPFLSVPVLREVWPDGMLPLGQNADEKLALAELKSARTDFEQAWDDWHRRDMEVGAGAGESLAALRDKRSAWLDAVLRDVFGWGSLFEKGSLASAGIAVFSPDERVRVNPTGALVIAETPHALVLVVDPQEATLDANYPDDGWSASALDRMAALLRTSESCSVGVVTDGRWWAVVSAPVGGPVAWGVTDSLAWSEDTQVRDAFARILDPRLLNEEAGIGGHTLPRMFHDSVALAEEVTESLGQQVRSAVELLVSAFGEASSAARRAGLEDPLPEDVGEVYAAAVTVMMRVVFLLFAQERSLLPQGELFTEGYGLLGVLDELGVRERNEGEEAMDGTSFAWHRLLATSQAIYAGATFEDMRLPAYGGSVFDPDRHPFLTAVRARGELLVVVSDRVMFHVLRSVQEVRTRRDPLPRRLSFREIDVEQVGYIYEGLLGYTCERATEPVVGLTGKSGDESELSLAQLERIREDAGTDPAKTAQRIVNALKESGDYAKGSIPAESAYARLLQAPPALDVDLKLTQTTPDKDLRERLRPWMAVVRADLRGKPVVFEPGDLYVTSTLSRKDAGAHYTPRSLAENVVEHALEPVVFNPGPYQTPDRSQWLRLSSDRILDLKIADIACGSGAFLVAAARYLASQLVEAWDEEGFLVGYLPDAKRILALRKVVARCLYGVDINEMAVEMCKLSLWLVSLDKSQPFSFVDNKVLTGNALLGITKKDQLTTLSINGKPRKQTLQFALDDQGGVYELSEGFERTMEEALSIRRDLAQDIDENDPMGNASFKKRQMSRYDEKVAGARKVADGIIAAGLELGGKPGRRLDEAYDRLRNAVTKAYPSLAELADAADLEAIVKRGLTPTVPNDYESWQCLHWPVEMPEVFERGGFDAIVGNPPFLGGQRITGSQGTNVRDWYVNVLAHGKSGSADLCAYFFLRAHGLLREGGSLGLLATNTIGQGATREVGLDQLVVDGFSIARAIRSEKWPVSSASLEYAAVWGRKGALAEGATHICDGREVAKISTLLEPQGRVEGRPVQLAENAGIAFQGCIVLGKGFVLEPDEAKSWIEDDLHNAEVLFPYLNGEDLNSRPDCSASRWVIDFNDRSEDDAVAFTLPYDRLLKQAKPERMKNNRKVYRDYWWQYAEKRPAMRQAISSLDEVIVIAQVSKTMMPCRVSSKQVLDAKLVVFASDSYAFLAILSSSMHQLWTVKNGTTMRTDPTYVPSAVFQTFPRPLETPELGAIGRTLDSERREVMLRRELGLTALYNLVNDPDLPSESDADVARMRQVHAELDEAVMAAYDWEDVPLNHGFYEYRKQVRWTVCPEARQEILDRLLEENLRRAARQEEGDDA